MAAASSAVDSIANFPHRNRGLVAGLLVIGVALATKRLDPDAVWNPPPTHTHFSPDGHWLIDRDAAIRFSFAHRGRNGDDTLKLTITDLGADNAIGGGDDKELFAKEYTTGTSAWAVYDSTTESTIAALGNNVRFAFSAVFATGGKGPDNTEGNFLDAAEFGVAVVAAPEGPKSIAKGVSPWVRPVENTTAPEGNAVKHFGRANPVVLCGTGSLGCRWQPPETGFRDTA